MASTWPAVAGIALALAASASRADVSVSVRMEVVELTLIDLNPDDSLSPWLQFEPTKNFTDVVALAERSAPDEAVDEERDDGRFVWTDLAADAAVDGAHAETQLDVVRTGQFRGAVLTGQGVAAAPLDGLVKEKASFESNGAADRHVVISPYTAVQFSVVGQYELQGSGKDAYRPGTVQDYSKLYAQTDIAVGYYHTDDYFLIDIVNADNSPYRLAGDFALRSVYANDSEKAEAATLSFWFRTGGQSIITSIPEPPAAPMALAGLALLTALRRRAP